MSALEFVHFKRQKSARNIFDHFILNYTFIFVILLNYSNYDCMHNNVFDSIISDYLLMCNSILIVVFHEFVILKYIQKMFYYDKNFVVIDIICTQINAIWF
jgi:hypothetical protein